MVAVAQFKRPESVLVVVHTPTLECLLLERAEPRGFWQSVTGSLRHAETPAEAAARELLVDDAPGQHAEPGTAVFLRDRDAEQPEPILGPRKKTRTGVGGDPVGIALVAADLLVAGTHRTGHLMTRGAADSLHRARRHEVAQRPPRARVERVRVPR